jgi:hypothetical protein
MQAAQMKLHRSFFMADKLTANGTPLKKAWRAVKLCGNEKTTLLLPDKPLLILYKRESVQAAQMKLHRRFLMADELTANGTPLKKA